MTKEPEPGALPYLALDLGAGNGRAFLGKFSEDRLEIEELHRFSNKPVYLHTMFYWDFLYLWDQVLESLRRCAAAGEQCLSGIGIDTWNVDFGLINEAGVLLMNPVSYRDQSCESVMDKISEIVSDEEIYSLTGLGLNTISALSRLYHLKNRIAPAAFAAARVYLPLADLFRFYLTGEKSGEETILWGSQLLNIQDRTWLTEIMERLHLPVGLFPSVISSGTAAGNITEEIKKVTTIEEAPVIAVAEHDTVSAALAVYDRGRGDIFISTGTWSVMGRFLDVPLLDSHARELQYLNEIAPDGVIFAKNLMGFYILEECIANWKRSGIDGSYERLISLAEAAPPFSLYIDVNDSALFSTANMEESLREHCIKSGQFFPEKPGPLVRGILEGLVFSYRQGIEDLEKLTNDKVDCVHIIGGGTKNYLFCQMIADGTNRNVTAAASEPAVLGNIGMQALARGRVKSLKEFHRIVENSVSPTVYSPKHPKGWDREYEKIKARIKGKSRYGI